MAIIHKHRWLLALLLLIILATKTGDWLASRHSWWVFKVPDQGDEPALPRGEAPPEQPHIEVPALPGRGTLSPASSPVPSVASMLPPAAKDFQDSFAPPFAAPSASRPLFTDSSLARPEIKVIHSRRIVTLAKGKPRKEDLARLQRAIVAFGSSLPRPMAILDADATSYNTVPVVLYESPEHDVTERVKAFYDKDGAVFSATQH